VRGAVRGRRGPQALAAGGDGHHRRLGARQWLCRAGDLWTQGPRPRASRLDPNHDRDEDQAMNLGIKRSPPIEGVAECGDGPRVMSGGGKGGSDGGTTTTVQKSEPWTEQKPFLTYGFNQAKNNYLTQQPQYFPGETVAPFSPETQQALSLEAA